MARKHGYLYGGASGEQAVKSAAVVVPIRKAVDPGKWPAYRTSPALLQQPIPSLPTREIVAQQLGACDCHPFFDSCCCCWAPRPGNSKIAFSSFSSCIVFRQVFLQSGSTGTYLPT